MQKGLSVYIETIGLSALGLLPFRQTVAPRRRGTSLLGFEDAVELGARREATLGRDDVVAIVRIFAHHILRHLKTYAAKPYAEGAVLTLVKILCEVPLGDAHAAREGQQVGCAVLVAPQSRRRPLAQRRSPPRYPRVRRWAHSYCQAR